MLINQSASSIALAAAVLPGRGASRLPRPARSAAALWLVTLLATTAAANWPSFQNGGQLSLSANVPGMTWELAWSREIAGYGQSSPVAWGDTIYVTSVSGPQKETYHVTALRLSDGSKLWQHDLENSSPRENTNYVSRAAPTPAADENGLVCFFEGGNVVALTHAGAVRWERNLVDEFGPLAARHGLGASVEQSETAAFIWVERAENPYVLAVEKATGTTLWKADGLRATSWATPRLVPVPGGHHLVLSGIGSLVGLDPQTGKRLWTLTGITGNSSPTPVPVGTGRFLQGATVGRGESGFGRAAESNGMIGIRQNDDGTWRADYVWRAKRATSSFGSPIAHRGHCYFVNASGVVYCLDLETGEERFAERLEESTWATPIALGDAILFFGKSGTICGIASGSVFRKLHSQAAWDNEPLEPAREKDEKATAPLSGPTLYAAAAVGGRTIIRSGERVFVYNARGGPGD